MRIICRKYVFRLKSISKLYKNPIIKSLYSSFQLLLRSCMYYKIAHTFKVYIYAVSRIYYANSLQLFNKIYILHYPFSKKYYEIAKERLQHFLSSCLLCKLKAFLPLYMSYNELKLEIFLQLVGDVVLFKIC